MTNPVPTSLLRRLPLIAVAVAAVLGFVYLGPLLNFQVLAENRQALLTLRDQHYLISSLLFILAYAVVVVTSVPGALIMTLAGGFLFGIFPGVLYNVAAAWLGAMAVFIAARTGLGHDIAARIARRGGSIGRLQTALLDNEWSVLLSMRLIPVLPFFITNLVPAFVGVRLSSFAITTLVGIIPADVIYTMLGAGLSDVFARGEVPHLDIIFKPQFLFPILGLAVLAMLPFLMRLFRRSQS
jgi:uncharacterized membrane protein YdjX (TVP38/TMEM64 family)